MATRKTKGWKREFLAVPSKPTSGTIQFRQVDKDGNEVPRADCTCVTPYIQRTALPKDPNKQPALIRVTMEEVE